MDTVRGMMMGFGILTIILTWKGVRNGENGALTAIPPSGLLSGVYTWTALPYTLERDCTTELRSFTWNWTTILLYAPWISG